MAKPEIDLAGTWHSRYEYSYGKCSEHVVDLRQTGLVISGASRLDETGSELFLQLWLRTPNVVEGFWQEKTSPKGDYKGQRFRGVLHGLVNLETQKIVGAWSGHNRDYSEVNSGNWTMERQLEEKNTDENVEV